MHTIVGVFDQREDAERAVQDLQDMGINNTDISYVRGGDDGHMEVTDAAGDAAKDTTAGAASGATTGAILGTVAGLAVANGILPGLGTLFVAGPLATALGFTGAAATTAAGAMTGAAAGGLVGALGGLGVSASDASNYEERVKRGNTLVTARIDDYDEAEVRGAFKEHDADDIQVYST
jgi:hypothetical protein